MKNLCLLFSIVLIFYACDKKELDSNPVDQDQQYQIDIYVAGYETNDSSLKSVATYWKNGVPEYLTDGTYEARATSIYVFEGDVYVAGCEDNEFKKSVAKYWKNGNPIVLTDGTHSAIIMSIFVSDGDVYAAGSELNDSTKNVAKYWKNGSPIELSAGSKHASAQSIFVANGDVHVAGYSNENSRPQISQNVMYWKNGVPEILNEEGSGWGTSVFVYNNDVYVGGFEQVTNTPEPYTNAKYWKNGIPQNLTSGPYSFQVSSIFVSNDDVYSAGYGRSNFDDDFPEEKYYYYALYWKNNDRVDLLTRRDDIYVKGNFVLDDDVYTAGYWLNGEIIGSQIPTAIYWKNNSLIQLSEERSGANAIFVTKTLVE